MLPYERLIIIENNSKIPVYRQIAISIINAIISGTLKKGVHLPSSRELSKTLGVHRKTVIASYEELDIQGWITSVPRKYVAVSEQIPVLTPQQWGNAEVGIPYENDLKIPFRMIEQDPVHAPVFSADIVIDDGHPDVRLSPIDSLLKNYRSFTSRKAAIKNANTGTTQGTLILRQELVNYLSVTRGLNISADHILVTHGAQMSIYLASQLLLGPSSGIIIGKPNYPVANKVFEETNARIIEVNVDSRGIDTDAIEKVCQQTKINAVYVIPHHHYPTTVTLSVERRVKLLELSKQFSFTIIEDDYDYDYHYTSSPYLPLASGDHHGNVIYIGSFSKVLDPALRMGFMVAPKNFIDQCTALRRLIDIGGDGYMQNALAIVIKEDELTRHIKKSKKCYHKRRDFLDALLREKLGKYISYTLPTGGMAIWIILNADFSVIRLAKSPLITITRWDAEQNAFRFGFASLNETELEQAVDLLKTELEKELRKKNRIP
ncbi:PLP-dependent aminotransferase family protein [Chryseobacterium sp.]|uniref:MocR-like pyridoxine biosynthesis transcription factor PdxR n=1 Tax=Chryseobacterium sp. TaxID=1871047 RepID=UPI0025BE7CB6|nr:PLP-dependent aminotransferase family protein [Chryseobacterium sp.]MBV8325189.1 PLP-dependent aminotransferase family protein [Chryseobacterium sp.]